MRSRHLVFTKQTKLEAMPSFIKIKKKSKHNAFSYQERAPKLLDKYMEYRSFIDGYRQRSVVELM